MTALLDVAGLSKGFGGIPAVREASFAVAAGEVLGVIGPNGSGKSTLFNCVLGQLAPDAGTVRFAGREITGLAPRRLSRLGVGRTFQMLQVFPGLSVRDNLIVAAQEHRGTLAGRLLAPADAGLASRADEMAARFGLTPLQHAPARSLSYGQQKLLDVAMAFMAAPRLVLLDEPAAGVNPRMQAVLTAHLRQLRAEAGAAFVIIEHNMEFVMGLCDRVLVLAEGRVLATGTPAAIRADPRVIEAYLGH